MLPYYLYKLGNRLLTDFATPLGDRLAGPGTLSGAIGDFQFDRRAVFYFADTQLVHLGDQLFHQPLLSLWSRAGFDVRVAVGAGFAPYYTSQGIEILAPEEYGNVRGAVIVTKNDLAHAVRKNFLQGNFFIGMNYHELAYPGRIVVGLSRAVYAALERRRLDLPELPPDDDPLYQPYVPSPLLAQRDCDLWAAQLTADPDARYLVYNDYVSSAFVEAKRRRSVIESLAREQRREGYKIIYVGTSQEKAQQPKTPDFIDIDLRGSFDPFGLYKLFSLPTVHGAISYDTFVMHVASTLRKDLYVVMRKGGDYWKRFRSKYVPMYPGADEIVRAYL